MKQTPVSKFVHQLNQWGKERYPFVFLIDFECESPQVWPIEQRSSSFHFNFNGKSNTDNSKKSVKNFKLEKQPESFESYQEKFNKVHSHLLKGDSFLVNLTASSSINTNLTLEEIYHSVNSKYKCWLENEFVCFSPETFVKIDNHQIRAYPMKGTIDALLPNAKDIILENEKEAAEHATIVDLIRNDLSKVANNIQVSKYRFYEEIKTSDKRIGQVSSEITGDLSPNYHEHIGDLIWSLLPAGSVSGAPKKKTLEIIQNTELNKRGYYCGVAGYFDGSTLDSCVLIRFLQENNIYRSGGGITFKSHAADEYQEMIDKIYVPIY